METIIKIIDYVSKNIIETGGVTVFTTLLGWALISLRSNHNRLKNSVTKDELESKINEAKQYTNEKIKIHEDKQVLEIAAIADKVIATHEMVTELWKNQINKKR